MGDAELLASPPITFRRVMDILDHQDLDLLCELDTPFGVVDLMLEGQELEHLRELYEYLEPLLMSETISEQDLEDLILRHQGQVVDVNARVFLTKLSYRIHKRVDALAQGMR